MTEENLDPTVVKEGGSQEVAQPEGTPIPIVGRRADAMAAVIARAQVERKEEIAALSGNLVPDEEPVEEVPSRPEAGGDRGPDSTTEEGEEAGGGASEELVRIVVDGEEREVPLSKIKDAGIRTLQKMTAADKRLEDATRLLKEAEAAAAERRTRPPEDSGARETVEPVDVDAGGEDLEELAYAIQMGDQQESAAALRKLIRKAQVPEKMVSKMVQEQLHNRDIVTRFSAPADQGGYSDLWDDLTLRQKADDEANRLLKEGAPNVWDTYKTAGENVRAWLREKAGAPPVKKPLEPETPRIVVSDEKKDKRTVDSLIGVSGKSQSQPTPKPRSASEIVADIKRMRGQL